MALQSTMTLHNVQTGASHVGRCLLGRRRNLLPALLCLLLPVSPAMVAEKAMAQVMGACTPNDGANVEAFLDPPVTAQDVEADRELLEEFIVYYRDETKKLEDARPERDSEYIPCISREKGGPWYSDSVYTVSVTLDGRILIHAKDMSLSARQLKPDVYHAILSGLGVLDGNIEALKSNDPFRVNQSLDAIAARLSTEPDGAFSFDGDPLGIPSVSAHAAVFNSSETGNVPIILIGGFDLLEAHVVDFEEERKSIDYGDPSTEASDVVDRETLQAFVMEVADYQRKILETGDPGMHSQARVALRDPNGPWRHDSVYVYIYEADTEQIVFHAGFPDQLEFRSAGITRDVVTGELVWDLVREAAARRPKPEGGSEGSFVSYYFDNPGDDTDEAVPKVGYALELYVPVTFPDGTETIYEFVVGSGFYPEGVNADEETVASNALACPVPDGADVEDLRNPPVTAQEVEADPSLLEEFIVYYRDEARSLEAARMERDSVYTACLSRDRGGPYYSDSIYTVLLTIDGRVSIHAKDMSLSARQLNPQIYAAILIELGVPDSVILKLGSPDPAVVQSAFAELVPLLSNEPDGAFSFPEQPGIPAASGHAAVYNTIESVGNPPLILIAGFDLTEAHLVDEDISHRSPSVEAKDVVDRETLQQFVAEAADYLEDVVETGDPAFHSRVRLEFRDPNGPWNQDSVYLYVYDKVTQQTILNGGFPDRFELRNAGITRDVVTGELVWDLVTEAAARRPEGGFLSYNFDNPADNSDEAVPKVGYARELVVEAPQLDGTTIPYEFIIGSGFYPDEVAAAAEQRKLTALASLKAWHTRFGRTVSQQVVDALQGRFAASPKQGLQLTVAGERLDGTTPLAQNQEVLAKLLGFEAVDSHQLAQGSSFSFTARNEDALAQLSLWGTGAFSSFSGSQGRLSLNGDVTTALVGADWSSTRWQAGAALSQSWGSGSYDGDGDNNADLTTTLTSLFPYGRYALTPRLGIWATTGYGWGKLTFNPHGTEYDPFTTMAMAAAGIDGVLLDGGSEGISLSTTADALVVKTTSEEVDKMPSSEGNVSRFRLGLEAARPVPLANGASLLPSMELGFRQDGGDAENGFGMDLVAGLSWAAPELGISGALKGRTLLTHADEDIQDQGLALSFSWDPDPSDRGLSLSMQHVMGTATGGMDALLNPVAMDTPSTASPGGQQWETRLAYGLAVLDDRLTLSPTLGLGLGPDSRRYSLLWALQPHSTHRNQSDPWQLSLDVQRREKDFGISPVDHSLNLDFSLSL